MENIFFLVILFLLPIFLLIARGRTRSTRRNLPPGSMGIPIIGQSLQLLRGLRSNTGEAWLQQRMDKYGPISKLSLFGKPTVFISGQAANKLIFGSPESKIGNNQTESLKQILGERCLLELSGEDHKRVRNALISFLKPDSLKQYVGKAEEEIKRHINIHWEGKDKVTVVPLMKTLTFDVICSLLFGIERGSRRDELVENFQYMVKGVWSVPINLPFTDYNKSLRATARVQKMLRELIHEKRVELEVEGKLTSSDHQDLITCLLSLRNQDNKQVVSEDEIVHNTMLLMIAGYETSATLITFLVRLLANNPTDYEAVLQEQEEIAKNKASGELLTWEDLSKMKYTWRTATETLRLFPPIFRDFRQALQDIEFGGYLIPKGWQIFWSTTITHMDSSIFQEPSKFDPARFENQASIPPYCLIPFGAGARICPGYEFAKLETLTTIHYLVTRFTWKLCCQDESFIRDPMPTPTQGLPIQLAARKLL